MSMGDFIHMIFIDFQVFHFAVKILELGKAASCFLFVQKFAFRGKPFRGYIAVLCGTILPHHNSLIRFQEAFQI